MAVGLLSKRRGGNGGLERWMPCDHGAGIASRCAWARTADRGCRCARPPANGWQASGLPKQAQVRLGQEWVRMGQEWVRLDQEWVRMGQKWVRLDQKWYLTLPEDPRSGQRGALRAISRGLRSAATTPPEPVAMRPHREAVPASACPHNCRVPFHSRYLGS